jgi:2-amino-4-hydroxy-6-hydroxymethyldihydropteridine diphosphokinase
MMTKVFLSLGSNQGNRILALAEAYWEISYQVGFILDVSSVYETEPWGFETDERFLNMVLEVETDLSPPLLMTILLDIEAGMGRTRQEGGYVSRVIDIDILFMDELVTQSGNPELPHPRMHLRRFVLQPMTELAPGFRHPVLGNSMKELLEACNDPGLVTLVLQAFEIEQKFRHWEELE